MTGRERLIRAGVIVLMQVLAVFALHWALAPWVDVGVGRLAAGLWGVQTVVGECVRTARVWSKP